MPANPQTIEKRFAVELAPRWSEWFSSVDERVNLQRDAGDSSDRIPFAHFCSPLTIEEFCDGQHNIWPGLTPPDCLPLTSNGYGDWLLARVDSNNQFSEVIHWFHGGGDWIPVGRIPQHAMLHDLVDRFRPVREQALRGDRESQSIDDPKKLESETIVAFSTRVGLNPEERTLLSEIKRVSDSNSDPDSIYREIIGLLLGSQFEIAAAIADQIETQIFNGSLEQQEQNELASAAKLCDRLIKQRENSQLPMLGWAHHICAEQELRQGSQISASRILAASLSASAFSDQSVRFGTQRFPERHGKYSVYRLSQLQPEFNEANGLTKSQLEYLDRILTHTASSADLRQSIFDWHLELGQSALGQADYRGAYFHFYDALTDLGVPSFPQAKMALEKLADAARLAGLSGLQHVAEFHLSAISSR